MAKAAKEPDDFLPLTPAEFHILMVLADDDLHGYGIMQHIEAHTNGTITLGPGTLYTTIKRLLERGWIAEVDAPPTADDPRRKYYSLTPFGNRVVRAEAERLMQAVATARELGLLGGTS
jgi:DNA-binding PadR family transcriptional regulator